MSLVTHIRQNGQKLTVSAVKLEHQRRQVQRRDARNLQEAQRKRNDEARLAELERQSGCYEPE